MPTLIQSTVVINVTLVPAAETATGLGDLVIFAPQGAVAGGNVFTVNSPTDVASLLSATNITAAGAEAINLAFAQSPRPALIRVVTYVAGSVSAALTLLAAQTAWEPGVLMFFGIDANATDITSIAALVSSNAWQYLVVTESDDPDLLTSGKPAALTAYEQDEVCVFYVPDATDGTSPGAAFAGRIAAKQLVGAGATPAASRLQLVGVDAPTLTSTQLNFAIGNDAQVVMQLDAGNSASERVVNGTKTYAGNGFTPVVSMLFAVKSIRQAISGLILSKAVAGTPILATAGGIAEVEQVVIDRLEAMTAAGHFVRDATYPLGFSVVGDVTGDEMTVNVYLRLPQEVRLFTFNITGEIVS